MRFSARTGTAINARVSVKGARQEDVHRAKGRLMLVGSAFILAYSFLAVRSFDLTVLQHTRHETNIMPPAVEALPVVQSAPRADIVDRNGVLLATSLEVASLYVDPKVVVQPERTAKMLVQIFGDLSYGTVLKKLQGDNRFAWIKRSITPLEQQEILEIGEPGLAFQKEWRRIYPQGDQFAHFVGYTNIDGKGMAGVERSFNNMLSAPGEPLKLTLDVRVQHILRREVTRSMDEFSGIGGAGIVMDVTTGGVVAAVSLPDFDPHDPTAVNTQNIFNRATQGVYELGSTFKIFSTAAALEIDGAGLAKKYDTRKPLTRGRFKIRDYHPEKRALTLAEVFIYSSNIGSALMGESLGTDRLKGFYRDLGLLSPLDFEISELGKPLIPSPWRDINTLTASYGHGIAVTPLHLISAVSSIVNGGMRVKPSLVMQDDVSGVRQDVRVVSPHTAHRMRQLMRLVVTKGTGSKADVEGYEVGGKTGTAEKSSARGYDRKRLISSFMGVFPLSNPRYAVFVMVDEPKGTKKTFGYATGGWVAAPAVAQVIKNMAPLMNVKPVDSDAVDFTDSVKRYIAEPKKE